MQRLSRLLTFCPAAALIAACGSSSDGDAPPPAAAPAAVAPTITQQPADATVTAGQPASFSVAATGTDPLTYQWQRNGADVAGAEAITFYRITKLFRILRSQASTSNPPLPATPAIGPA